MILFSRIIKIGYFNQGLGEGKMIMVSPSFQVSFQGLVQTTSINLNNFTNKLEIKIEMPIKDFGENLVLNQEDQIRII